MCNRAGEVPMAVSEGFREYVREQIGQVISLTMRSMFGGVGLYSGGIFFALMDDDTLYFKVDDRNRPEYEARGMGPFRPFGDDRMTMQYYELPAEVLEEREELRIWIRRSVEAALRKTNRKSGQGSRPGQKRRRSGRRSRQAAGKSSRKRRA